MNKILLVHLLNDLSISTAFIYVQLNTSLCVHVYVRLVLHMIENSVNDKNPHFANVPMYIKLLYMYQCQMSVWRSGTQPGQFL